VCRLHAIVEPEETDGRRRQLKGRRRRRTQPGGRGGIGFDRPGSPIPIPLGGEGTCFHVYISHLCKFSHLLALAHTCAKLHHLSKCEQVWQSVCKKNLNRNLSKKITPFFLNQQLSRNLRTETPWQIKIGFAGRTQKIEQAKTSQTSNARRKYYYAQTGRISRQKR